jgi:hypothetical protein
MKGGITSGVVYPLALTELAKRYRFAHIGGTSAGAMAAAVAAAAEYGRGVPGKGFMRLASVPAQSGPMLLSLFQPSRKLAPIFNMLVASLQAKSVWGGRLAILWQAICGFRWSVLPSAIGAALIAFVLCRCAGVGGWAFGALLVLLAVIGGALVALRRAAWVHLPANDYGLCTGIRQPGFSGDGFSDWLANLIDDTAGRTPDRDDPLTFGDLATPAGGREPIKLRMITTNLTMSRPYTLPFEGRTFVFERAEFAKIFPPRIMTYLLSHSERVTPETGQPGEFYKFPDADRLPVVVAARMSLSFPILICAVPLYARDFTLKGDDAKKLQRCLFSDGGLSSNFPIHFFDRMLPNTPTFGISLDDYDVRRDRHAKPMGSDGKDANNDCDNRVWMPEPAETRGGQLIPIVPFNGLGGFLWRLVDAAKDWQDNLQSTLAGSRDRIVHVYLKPDEGGLNIAMPPKLVEVLAGYGACAGRRLRDDFDLDEHRWRRFLVAMDRFNQTMNELFESYDGRSGSTDSFATFLARYPEHAESYKQAARDAALLRSRVDDLVGVARKWSETKIPPDDFPRPPTDLRVTPRI